MPTTRVIPTPYTVGFLVLNHRIYERFKQHRSPTFQNLCSAHTDQLGVGQHVGGGEVVDCASAAADCFGGALYHGDTRACGAGAAV